MSFAIIPPGDVQEILPLKAACKQHNVDSAEGIACGYALCRRNLCEGYENPLQTGLLKFYLEIL